MRILLLLDTNAFAGTERHVLDLALALRDAGAFPTLGCPSDSPLAKRAAAQGLPHFPLAREGFFDWRGAKTLRRALRAGHFEVFHAHNGRTHLRAALDIAWARRGALVFTQHFIEPAHTHQNGLKKQLSTRIHRILSARTARFIAISGAVKAAMIARGQGDETRIQIVPNGIGDPLQSEMQSAEITRQKWQIAPDAPLVVCAARLETEKDHATLLEAFAALVQSVPGARLLLAGEGTRHGDLETQIAALKIEKSAHLLGFVADIFSLLRAADVFVLPSPREPFGLVFIEAMALSKPVIACDAGAAPEIIESGKTGFLVPPHSPGALKTALETLLLDAAKAREMGQNGRARYETHFTRDLMAKRTLDVYRAALEITKRGRN